ncbi:U6 snRNA (guanine-N(2))-methyltransferase THUMPD2-like [Tubulanus polymorphus]|uniref:U6 snRNA (guanine-N(2))-methyltransferase THUMPD2-like n=1 Tax=Tubulanus polymorphus TaxID=672921 RepID=UPI003DA27499
MDFAGTTRNYFITAGRGTEIFASSEIERNGITGSEFIEVIDGKVFFESTLNTEILKLTITERLFIEITRLKNLSLPRNKGKSYKILNDSLADKQTWLSAYSDWRYYQSTSELNDDDVAAKSGEISKHALFSGEQQKCPSKTLKRNVEECHLQSECLTDRKRDLPTFRVSCKIAGKHGKMFSNHELSKMFGKIISEKSGWKVDLKSPKLEIFCQLNDDHLLIGIPLTKQPLSKRSYIKKVGLRSTIAAIMVHEANIQDGYTVVDPMCGKVTILIEAAKKHKNAQFIGCDLSCSQIHDAAENVLYSKTNHNIELIQADVKCLSLKSSSVDSIVCDVPFGMKHGDSNSVIRLYPEMVKEMDRVSVPGGRIVILTSMNLRSLLLSSVTKTEQSEQHSSATTTGMGNITSPPLDNGDSETCSNFRANWTILSLHYLKLGETHACLCVFEKRCSDKS